MSRTLICNASIIDGSGTPCFQGNVLVENGLIAEVSSSPISCSCNTIDAECLALVPGFIDLHTHSDISLLIDPTAASHLHMGVTTQVVGNCGFSAAPCFGAAMLSRNLLGFIPSDYGPWRDMASYLSDLNSCLYGSAFSFVGHAALRSCVLGYEDRKATSKEIDRMCVLLEKCLDQGAVGLSSGLEYFPGNTADPEELYALCQIVASKDKLYATHVRNRDVQFRAGFQEAVETASRTGVRCQISHAVPKYGVPHGGAEEILQMIEQASATCDIAFDVIPYTWGSTALTAILPSKLAGQPIDTLILSLQDPEIRTTFHKKKDFFWKLISDHRWSEILLYDTCNCKEWQGLSFEEIGRILNEDPLDAMLDVLIRDGSHMGGTLMLGHFKDQSDLDLMIQHPLSSVISDSISLNRTGPLSAINWSEGCYGWIPTFLRDFVFARPILSIEEAIHKITSAPASRLHLNDRGMIKPGLRADLVLLDFSKYICSGLEKQYAQGVRSVWVNGNPVLCNDSIL